MSERTEELKAQLKAKIEKYQGLLNELNGSNTRGKIEPLAEVKQRVSKKKKMPKMMTGEDWFDNRTGGIEQGTYINLAGQSFGGKTTLALKILCNIAEYNQAALFNFEMYEDKLVKRLNHLSDNQNKNLLIIQENYDLDFIEKTIRDLNKKGIIFFVIDSRMKINVGITDKQEYQQIAYLSNRLSKLTQELGIILIQINQISEEDLKKGRLSLKGSGDQYYDSDMVLFITIEKDKETGKMKRFCHCTKDRDGEEMWVEDITESKVETHVYDEKLEMEII